MKKYIDDKDWADIDHAEYYKFPPEEREKLKEEVIVGLQQFVIDICTRWEDISSEVDHLTFGGVLDTAIGDAISGLNFDCPWLCGYAWGTLG